MSVSQDTSHQQSDAEIQFARMISAVRDYAIYLLSPQGHIVTWNAGAERFKGYATDEIIGEHFSRFYTEEDRAMDLPARALQTALSEGKFESEGWRVRKDGSRFWAHVVIDPLFDDAGQPIGFAKITRDITEQRRARERQAHEREAALAARTEEYRQLLRLFEQAPGFVCFFRGPEHVYELQNAAHHRLAEFKDIIGKPVRQALPELEGQGFFELLDGVFESGTPYVGRALPLMVKPASGGPGEQRYIDFVYQPIFDEEGRVVGVFSQGSDVTEQVHAQQEIECKQAELEALVHERTRALEEATRALQLARELQLDKNHLLQLFEQAPGFICVLRGRDHVFDLANRAYRSLIGERDVVGKSVAEALPEVAAQGFITLLDQVYASGEPFIGSEMALDIRQSDGTAVTSYLDFVYQPIRDAEGRVSGIFVQGSDVTARKLAQDELKRYQTDLEALVSERTRALEETREALQRSQKLEAIGKLTGGIAHDFNNILQIIGGNLQLLHGHVVGNALAVKRVDTASDAVTRGAKLSSQLLAFARRQPLQPAVVNLARVINSMDDMFQRALGELIEVETICVGGLWNALVDPNQLENVVLNLAINARDAMPNGGRLTIELGNATLDEEYVSSESDIAPGQYVMLAISDTGTGMSREVMERACDPFFTTKPEGVGTGLGLSMAYGFVKQSGGHFKIYSEVGHGTTIRIYFPRSHEALIEAPVANAGTVVGGSETILVVEDDAAVQATVVALLGDLGYRVLKADDAGSALGILKSGLPIDLLFTDVVMPGKLRSPELARQAKLLHPDIAVLFTSGYTQNAIVHGGRLDPGVELISKPYRREQLARKIRHVLSNRQQQLQSRQALAKAPPSSPHAHAGAVRRVLVVEDDEELREMTSELIRVLGHHVECAANAEAALAMLAASRYDILLSDVGLPGIDGVELARRALRDDPQLRVVFASGHGENIDAEPGLSYVVLPKPYTLRRLEAALEEVIQMPVA
ncbi:hybrid sensor histidine kinase/response regulator [Noviherbaspirillum pedocola]|uniref:histidine kinase n=1 Tax=Noviherbaspirillum pedocola TaxID=2801341 RepID=A0A934SX40_9BURK|nr:PAS domain-containing protein [Noviherbaspirillum pedocola]MBK4738436.1 PAS domain-containing protein [Noviherbaspirillum pedocola]